MNSRAEIVTDTEATLRENRIHAAFYRGNELTLGNPAYVRALQGIADELLRQDREAGDLTVNAMRIGARRCTVEIRAKELGIAAGISEAAWLYEREGLTVERRLKDGDAIQSGDMLLQVTGNAGPMLSLERLAVNLLQRMSGIATATRKLVGAAQNASPNAHVVATRKTLWGLLDKRAVHCGGGGTHRLNLSDAILIKTNHLRLISGGETGGPEAALACVWKNRGSARFFEVEVTCRQEAVAVAHVLSNLQATENACACVLMLDNFSPADSRATVAALRDAGLCEGVLLEASGNVSESSIAAYSAAGVDAISIGALTHSTRALDLSAKLIPDRR